MGDDLVPNGLHHRDFDPWGGTQAGFPDDPWHDPAHERAGHGRRLRRLLLGFAILGFALVVASLNYLADIATYLFDLRQVRMGLQDWDFALESVVVFASSLGVCLLWGRWPDQHWQRRSGLLLMMCLGDIILWSIDHATRLGLADAPFGHDHFRHSLGAALGWSQFALIVSLATDLAALLGDPRAEDLGRTVRSLITVGVTVWFLTFYIRTNWRAPIWPLQKRPLRPQAIFLLLGNYFLTTIVVLQVTGICLYAARVCSKGVRQFAAEDKADDSFLSRSEAAWDEYHRDDPDRHGR